MDQNTQTPKKGDSVLLSSLDDVERAALLSHGQRRNFRAGESIFLRGDEGASMLIITDGRVEISITAMNGRKSTLNHMGPGEVLGEVALFDQGTRSADATAATKVEALNLSRRDVSRFLQDHPDATLALIGELCAKVRNASDMFEVQSQVAADTRLARCILRIGEKWGDETEDGEVRISTAFSQTDIGELSGLARENVNRHMKAMIEDGLIRMDGRKMTITDVEGLSDLAEI